MLTARRINGRVCTKYASLLLKIPHQLTGRLRAAFFCGRGHNLLKAFIFRIIIRMNDQRPPLQAPSRPKGGGAAKARQAGQGRKPMPRPLTPAQSQMVGYAVLGVGILAAISVLIMAFRGGVDTGGPEPDPQVTASLQQDISRQEQAVPATVAKESKLALKRQKISAGSLSGGWKALIGDYMAVLQMDNGAYQVILASADPVVPRLYSSGSYTMIDDIIVLSPRSDWKAPTPPAGSSIEYERLTRGDYAMVVGFQDGAMVWQSVPSSETRVSYSRSPLLLEQGRDYIVWKKAN